MSLLYVPEIRKIVSEACNDIIDQGGYSIRQSAPNEIQLVSPLCGIRIIAGISPIGERDIDVRFYDPNSPLPDRKYYSHTMLLYSGIRMEPRDIIKACPEEKESFDDTLRDALECFTRHTLKYRKDILSGDFTSWLPKTN